jgi:type 1 glutamine amidotransferase
MPVRLTPRSASCAALAALLLLSISAAADDASFKVLVFTKTTGYKHDSIPVGAEAIKKIGETNGFEAVISDDSSVFSADGLKPYKVVVSLSTTGTKLFTDEEKEAFKTWFKAGNGWVGIHAASDALYDWPWYGGLVGAYFRAHPAQQNAKILVVDRTHQSTAHLPEVWERKDEWYAFKELPKDVHVLIKIDETSYNPDKANMSGNHPMAWWHLYEGGRAFYTELGHTKESFADPLYLKHIAGAILWAANKTEMPK